MAQQADVTDRINGIHNVLTPFGKGVSLPLLEKCLFGTAITTLYMNAFVYAMFIFVKMQNCVKWHMDTCLSWRNRQEFRQIYSKVHKQKGKIENATAFIDEIDSHKKSIFEFWKYSNKDEVQALEEGMKEIEITYANGITYKGGFKNNTISGTGTMTYPNVGKYEGSFSEGKRSGQGTFTWNDGVNYVGAWNNDLMHGQGQYNISSTIYLKGSFDNGKLNGTYTYHNEKGNYKTTWVNNKNTKVEEE